MSNSNMVLAVRQEVMDARYKRLLARFRHMMVASGAMPQDVTTAQLIERIRGTTDEERIANLEELTAMVPEAYWWEQEL